MLSLQAPANPSQQGFSTGKDTTRAGPWLPRPHSLQEGAGLFPTSHSWPTFPSLHQEASLTADFNNY